MLVSEASNRLSISNIKTRLGMHIGKINIVFLLGDDRVASHRLQLSSNLGYGSKNSATEQVDLINGPQGSIFTL
jgi:hypothetical protein